PYCKIPEYKVCAVRIEKIPDSEAYTAEGVYITQAMVAEQMRQQMAETAEHLVERENHAN
ncbi:MAG TPA: hypothetical protein DCF42_04070, partial [Lachnospiraceae bacterium]|nr:hypothetical protein [Lachnospiraceae bacterium]